jgi:putative PIN family toxin of toxin-antitoxin system
VPPRKERIPVVFDTNVVIGQAISPARRSANARVYDLWLVERRLQLVVSPPLIAEYLEVLERIGTAPQRISRLQGRLLTSSTVTRTNLGKRFSFSRDPDDNMLLATAHTGRAAYLVTNDRDLLEIPDEARRLFRFEIIKPAELLRLLPA